MSRSASGSTGGRAGVVVAGTEPPNDGCACCCCAPLTRVMNWLMMSRSSFVIGTTLWVPWRAMWLRGLVASMVREAQAADFDHRAAVHHHRDTGLPRPLRRSLVYHA